MPGADATTMVGALLILPFATTSLTIAFTSSEYSRPSFLSQPSSANYPTNMMAAW